MSLDPVALSSLSPRDQQRVASIVREMRSMENAASRMGMLLISMSEEGRKAFVGSFPLGLQEFWRRIEGVGRKQIHPRLATMEGRAAECLRSLPLEEQEHYMEELLPLVVWRGSRLYTTRKGVLTLSEKERKQVFEHTGGAGPWKIRSPERQRKLLRETRLAAT